MTPEQLELHFVFAAVWAFGGNLLADKSKDHRKAFSNWWQEEFKTVKFPADGLVYDYCLVKYGPSKYRLPSNMLALITSGFG